MNGRASRYRAARRLEPLRRARVRAAFFPALLNSAFPFVRTALFAAAFRLPTPRFFAALFVCFDNARCEAVDFGSLFITRLRAADRRADVFFAPPDCPFS
jgi:hypothetical protein